MKNILRHRINLPPTHTIGTMIQVSFASTQINKLNWIRPSKEFLRIAKNRKTRAATMIQNTPGHCASSFLSRRAHCSSSLVESIKPTTRPFIQDIIETPGHSLKHSLHLLIRTTRGSSLSFLRNFTSAGEKELTEKLMTSD